MQQLWHWYKSPYNRITDFSGRSRRGEYWTFTLVNVLVLWAATAIDLSSGTYSSDDGIGLVSGVLSLLLIIPSVPLAIRRLHDSEMSGFWLLVGFIPLVGWLVHLINMLKRGMRGPNRYGPDPRGHVEVAAAEDGGPPYAVTTGRFMACPWCGQTNPRPRESCQWCHKPYREP
ncbi:MAG: DUF805 domain-containing protein [Coriobacteriia bacterium]|nr:DUF805 domain-containing protein [Coriobacteriia bacterium]